MVEETEITICLTLKNTIDKGRLHQTKSIAQKAHIYVIFVLPVGQKAEKGQGTSRILSLQRHQVVLLLEPAKLGA